VNGGPIIFLAWAGAISLGIGLLFFAPLAIRARRTRAGLTIWVERAYASWDPAAFPLEVQGHVNQIRGELEILGYHLLGYCKSERRVGAETYHAIWVRSFDLAEIVFARRGTGSPRLSSITLGREFADGTRVVVSTMLQPHPEITQRKGPWIYVPGFPGVRALDVIFRAFMQQNDRGGSPIMPSEACSLKQVESDKFMDRALTSGCYQLVSGGKLAQPTWQYATKCARRYAAWRSPVAQHFQLKRVERLLERLGIDDLSSLESSHGFPVVLQPPTELPDTPPPASSSCPPAYPPPAPVSPPDKPA
jgi:hypothetical protein